MLDSSATQYYLFSCLLFQSTNFSLLFWYLSIRFCFLLSFLLVLFIHILSSSVPGGRVLLRGRRADGGHDWRAGGRGRAAAPAEDGLAPHWGGRWGGRNRSSRRRQDGLHPASRNASTAGLLREHSRITIPLQGQQNGGGGEKRDQIRSTASQGRNSSLTGLVLQSITSHRPPSNNLNNWPPACLCLKTNRIIRSHFNIRLHFRASISHPRQTPDTDTPRPGQSAEHSSLPGTLHVTLQLCTCETCEMPELLTEGSSARPKGWWCCCCFPVPEHQSGTMLLLLFLFILLLFLLLLVLGLYRPTELWPSTEEEEMGEGKGWSTEVLWDGGARCSRATDQTKVLSRRPLLPVCL